MSTSPKALNLHFETREVERVPVILPASMFLNGTVSAVRIVNISRKGAQVETAASISRRCRVTLRCGQINAEAIVIWVETDRVGVRFLNRQSWSDIAELIARHEAVRTRHQSSTSSQTFTGGDA